MNTLKRLSMVMILVLSNARAFDFANDWDQLPGGSAKIPMTKSEVKKAYPQPSSKPKCVRIVKSTIEVKENQVFDGQGCLYTWQGQGYPASCGLDKSPEGMPAMFLLKPGSAIKNLHLECALDGIHTTKNNIIKNVVFRDVEEDAVTIGENITIEKSEFWFCQDKCLQMNSAMNSVIRNSIFVHASTPIRANYGRNISVYGNIFYNVKRAVKADQKLSKVTAFKNKVNRADCYLASGTNATIYDKNDEDLHSVKNAHCENGGKIYED